MKDDVFLYVKNDEKKSDSFFDFIVSNPPYQKDTGNGATAIYHFFMNVAQTLSNNVSMIYPFRWVLGGRGDKIEGFRKKELSSSHYRIFAVDPREKGVFDDALIKGGVNYFHWTIEEHSQIFYYYADKMEKRNTLLDGVPMMIQNPSFRTIVDKFLSNNYLIPYSVSYYGISSPTEIQRYEKLAEEKDDTVVLYYSGKGGGVRTANIPLCMINKSVDKYKVVVSATADPDATKTKLRRPGRVFSLKPYEIPYTTFIQIGEYDTQEEADRCVLYLKTDIITFLIGIITTTQHCTRSNYRLVPNVNFKTGEILGKPGVFLDFAQPDTLNEQLENIYDISYDEMEMISSSVRPWKDKYSLTADGLF